MKIITPNLIFFGWYILSCVLATLSLLSIFPEPLISIFESYDDRRILSAVLLLIYHLVSPRNETLNKNPWTKSLSALRLSDFSLEVCLKIIKWILIVLIFTLIAKTIDHSMLIKIADDSYSQILCSGLVIVYITEKYAEWWRKNLSEI
jgi:hypothetical protein